MKQLQMLLYIYMFVVENVSECQPMRQTLVYTYIAITRVTLSPNPPPSPPLRRFTPA